MLTAATTSSTSINLVWWQALAAAGTVAFVALAAGIIVIFGRRTFVGSASQRSPADAAAAHPAGQGAAAVPAVAAPAPGPVAAPPDQSTSQPDGDFIRSWIAVVLVIGLVFFCAFAFSLNDQSLQSTLIGGLIASVGSAIAFYFSSKASDKARQDVANAANLATDLVRDQAGQSRAAGRRRTHMAVTWAAAS